MTRYQNMTPEQQAESRAQLDAYQASKPTAVDGIDAAVFSPGVIFFVNGEYRGVSSDTATPWPWIKLHMETLLAMMPMQHRLDCWRERIECGATMALAFFSSKDWQPQGAGILNCEMTDDGKPIVLVAVCTFEPLIFEHAARIAEVAALGLGAEQVHLWTPKAVPLVEGYHVENCWFGQLQVGPVRPIQ